MPKFGIGECKHGQESIKIHSFEVKEKFEFKNELDLRGTLRSLYKQCKGYKEIFRDGQDTIRRNFIFKKHCEITYEPGRQIEFAVDLTVSNEESPRFTITTSCDSEELHKQFDLSFFKSVYDKQDVKENDESTYEISDKSERSGINC